MASLIIHDLEESVQQRLRRRAESRCRSVEEEARDLLRAALEERELPAPRNTAEAIHRRFAAIGGGELDLPTREPMRDPPRFD